MRLQTKWGCTLPCTIVEETTIRIPKGCITEKSQQVWIETPYLEVPTKLRARRTKDAVEDLWYRDPSTYSGKKFCSHLSTSIRVWLDIIDPFKLGQLSSSKGQSLSLGNNSRFFCFPIAISAEASTIAQEAVSSAHLLSIQWKRPPLNMKPDHPKKSMQP